MKQQQDVQRRARAERVYARFLRLYPRTHRQAFGEPMLQAFRDHYCDAIETEGESEQKKICMQKHSTSSRMRLPQNCFAPL